MSDLTDEELEGLEYHGCSSGTSTPPTVREAIVKATLEIRRHRAAQAASKERVRSVVLEAMQYPGCVYPPPYIADAIASRVADQLATPAVLSNHDREVIGWIIEDAPPVHRGDLIRRTMGRVLGFRPAHAAPVVLSAEELRGMQLMRRHLDEGGHDWREGTAMADVEAARLALDRLLGGKP